MTHLQADRYITKSDYGYFILGLLMGQSYIHEDVTYSRILAEEGYAEKIITLIGNSRTPETAAALNEIIQDLYVHWSTGVRAAMKRNKEKT